MILHLYSPLVRHLSTVSSSGLPRTSKRWTYWSESNTGPQMSSKDWSIICRRRDWKSLDCLPWRRDLLSISIHIWLKGMEKREPDSSQWCPVIQQEATGTKWIPWNSIQKILLLWLWSNAGTGWYLCGDIQNLTDMILGNLLYLTLFEQGGGIRQSQEVPSKLNDAVILFDSMKSSNTWANKRVFNC